MKLHKQIWLTSVLTDTEVPKALTLFFSLRRATTSRKIGVIVSPGVSCRLQETLEDCFDFFVILREDRNVGLKKAEYVKLFGMTLKNFELCVMLTPDMMAVKNCDELFDWAGKHCRQFASTKNGDASVIAMRPSLPEFHRLLQKLVTNGGKWAGNKTETRDFIDEKYNRNLMIDSEMLMENGKDVSIVKLPGQLGSGWETPLGLIGQPTEEQSISSEMDSIAIVGMSCRYPGANSLEEFWEILLEGKDATGKPPAFRWQREQSSIPMKQTNAGFLKCPVDEFDAKFFGLSPKEMSCLDPQHRILHELVWEGLEDAAINPQSLEGTNGGVFTGSWTNEFKEILTESGNDNFYRKYMGNSIGAGAARISHLLGLTGPSIATESGCSAAMVAVHLACKSLERRETNLALACGVNLLLRPFDKELMPMVLSPDGRCKTFDAKADGFGRAEGAGVLVLKRVSDALRDGDKIWALIRGSGMSQEGVSKSMGTPTVHTEALAMTLALEDANVEPSQISYVETHGTGTAVGDPLEVAAIAKAYHSKERKEPLLIGSVKTNVGHTESCSGITGIMKVVLALHHEIIPPHRNLETLNPAIDLDAVPAQIPLQPVDWKKELGSPRLAGVSSFGITGTDAHAIIQEAPNLPGNVLACSSIERPLHIMKITAKTGEALDALLDKYKTHLTKTSSDFKDIAHTANIGRADFSQRAILIAKSNEDAVKIADQNKFMRDNQQLESNGKVCFLFTGQGSQYPRMGKELYETSPVFRMHFEYCQKILKNSYNIDITQVLWSESKSAEVSRTIYSQTSIFCVEYALLKLWESWGVKPDYVVGHSLGEFAAAVCTGILSVEDALKLVAERSRLIDELPRGKMLVIKADKARVAILMKKFAAGDTNKMLDYAAINSPEQTVVAGDSEVVLHFGEYCKKAGLKCIVLDATHAFHSKHMDPMLDKYRIIAKTVKNLGGNDCKYISGMRGSLVEADKIDAEYWVDHTREKVSFLDASQKAVELGCRTFLEIGPQPVLSALTLMNNDLALTCLPSLKRNENEWNTLINTLGKLYVSGVQIDWEGFDKFYRRTKVSLPHYPFEGKVYWPDVGTVSGSPIHPLLGSPISNASSTKLFQAGLNLSALEFIKDHAIGEKVIFPGAGYLEMCLAAGLAAVEGSIDSLAAPTRAMKVENLTIEAPLCLTDSKTCQIQTVVELNTSNESQGDWNDMKVGIFRRVESESGKWLPHAKASFCPVPSAEEKEVQFDINQFQETLQLPSKEAEVSQFYGKLASVGLKFGPTFKSIEKIWRENSNSKTLLAKVKVPPNDGTTPFIIHPVVVDAMIQATMMLRHASAIKKKLYVPIKIGKFLWLREIKPSKDIYIHVNDSSAASALLVDSSGAVLAQMSSIELIDTTVKALESVLEQQTISMPDIWEEVWKPEVAPFQYEFDLKLYENKRWLLFHSDELQISSYLKNKIDKVITVVEGPNFEIRKGDDAFYIRKGVEEDYIALFESLKADKVHLEGIVYCWALQNVEASNQEEILQPVFYLTQSLLNSRLAGSPRLIGITKGVVPVGSTDLSGFGSSTLWGFVKSLKNENNEMPVKMLDVEGGDLNEEQLEEIFHEIWKLDKETMVAYREGSRYTPKFQKHKPTGKPLEIPPGIDKFQLILPSSKSISELQFGPLELGSLKPTLVEVEIKAAALNFRDVLSVLKPTDQFRDINAVGIDVAGVVTKVGAKVNEWKVGDRVFSSHAHSIALPSHAHAAPESLLRVPEDMTMGEAATIPTVYITSIKCLLEVAKIQKEDWVLLHTASGGVGLSAIELCKFVGCKIIATAGSKRKQNYLRSLGIEHIFHSRNTQFGDQILELTNGRGFDVVLNSLTSEGFKEATLKACGKGARFVEMSKLNVWTEEEVKELRPDVDYTIVDVSSADIPEKIQLLSKLDKLLRLNVVKPVPYERFDALDIIQGLGYLQKAKHIGKIVCTMPQLRKERGESKVWTPMFHENCSYLITGGLGGIGFVVCQWMVEKGAKHVIVAGRSPPSSSIQTKISEMNSKGANVIPVQLDVANFEECRKLIQSRIGEMGIPPVRGVMHAAGTLSDGLIVNQTWPKLSSTFNTKVNGTLNLHELTKDLNMEHFVMFSSIAAMFGSPGQSNHAAGNCFEDAFIHYRHSIGLPGTTVNWGQWGEVGIATEVDLPGIKTLSNLQGIAGLEYALNSQRPQLTVANVDSFQLMSKLFPHLSVYLDERVWKAGGSVTSVTFKTDDFWQEYDSKSDVSEKLNFLKGQLKNILKSVLILDDKENIKEHEKFEEMGVDSLTFVEIKNHLQALLGQRVTISASALKDSNAVEPLAQTLLNLIENEKEVETLSPTTLEEVNELIREDSVLPEHIRAAPGQKAKSFGEIKTVFLTGCTGTLGPYLLRELTQLSQITQVICLIREKRNVTVEERLTKLLEDKGLLPQINMDKVRVVRGNVALPHLGMDEDVWEKLSESVDAIFNSSAHVTHTEIYRRTTSTYGTRAVNVGGMKNLLEFAVKGKLKHFCHSSSLLAVVTTDKEGKLSEDWPKINDFDSMTVYAYPVSKFVGDVLAKEAVERGIPCKSLRFPFIQGEEKTGRCEPDSNHLLLRYIFMLKSGSMPSTPLPILALPVDTCAEVGVRLFFDERAPSDVYNIANANPDVDQAFRNVAKRFGRQLEIVEFKKFIECVTQGGGDTALKHFQELYNDGEGFMAMFSNQSIIKWVEGNEVYRNKKVARFIPNFYENQRPSMEYIHNDLSFLKQNGWFEKFGL